LYRAGDSRRRNLAIFIDSVTGAADGVCPTPYAAINMMLYDKHGDFSDNCGKPHCAAAFGICAPYY
jgi:hypothetical protein